MLSHPELQVTPHGAGSTIIDAYSLPRPGQGTVLVAASERDSMAAHPAAMTVHLHLAELCERAQDAAVCLQPAGSLVAKTRSLDQARAVVTFLDAASEKTLRSTVALTAARGRGKSAALGLAIAGALALGYSNIFVTAPSPENLRTLFEFVFKVRDAPAPDLHACDVTQQISSDPLSNYLHTRSFSPCCMYVET